MSTIERITITLTAEMAQAVRGAVQACEYASSSEIIRETLRDWRHQRALQERELGELRAQVQEALADSDRRLPPENATGRRRSAEPLGPA